jgi:hypothetical protein
LPALASSLAAAADIRVRALSSSLPGEGQNFSLSAVAWAD